MAFIFGGNTGMSYEEMVRQRDLATQLAGQIGQGGYTALGAGLASGILSRRADKAQTKGREAAQGRAQSVLGQLFGQQVMGGQPMQGGGAMPPVQYDANSPEAIGADAMAALGKPPNYTPGDKESFIAAMMPHALAVSERTGLDPRLVIAQAAQETGWGKSAPNNNYFGIKSHGKGGGGSFSTTEYVDGKPVTITDSFRGYGGMGESAQGYADFLMENPRYREMLAAGDLDGQLAALGQSGYATDPNYAASVGNIARSIDLPAGGQQTTTSAQNAPQGGGMDMSGLVAAMSDPYLDDGTRSVLGQMFQQQMQRQDPAYQMGMRGEQLALEKAQLELDQMRNPQAKPGYRTLSPQEAQQIGLPEGGVYQVSPEGQIDVVREPVAPEAPKMTSDMQEYEFARSQGYEGTFQQYQTDMKRAGATSVNVTPGGEPSDGPLRKKLSEKEGEAWSAYMDSGTISSGTMQDMQLLDELITMAPQGPISGRIAGAFPGVNSAADAFTSVVKRVAPTLRAPGSGATSDIEYDGMLKSLPQLSSRPEANAAISGMMKAKAQINIERGQIVSQYQNGEISAADARQAINDLNSRSILTPELESLFGAMGGDPQAASAPEGIDPADWEVMTPEERALWD